MAATEKHSGGSDWPQRAGYVAKHAHAVQPLRTPLPANCGSCGVGWRLAAFAVCCASNAAKSQAVPRPLWKRPASWRARPVLSLAIAAEVSLPWAIEFMVLSVYVYGVTFWL